VRHQPALCVTRDSSDALDASDAYWSDEEIASAFEQFDEASPFGNMDSSELRKVLSALGVDVDDTSATRLLRIYDDDRNGLLDLAEFTRLVRQLQSGGLSLPACYGTVAALRRQLEHVRALKGGASQYALWKAAGLKPNYKVSGGVTGAPSFTQLFNHTTWTEYTGVSPFERWFRAVVTWPYSTVFASVLPLCLFFAAWGYAVASVPARWLPKMTPVPLTMMGSAIGLVLVFRVNNLYGRLMEARGLWGRAVFLARQAAQSVATCLLFDETLPEEKQPAAHEAAAQVCRYLAACAWELRSKLTGKAESPGRTRDLLVGEDTEVLDALLTPAEAKWFATFRSRPLVLLGACRRVLHGQYRAGTLDRVMYRKLDEDLKEMDLVVGGCERLFSSPAPPTMARHGVRSMFLWLLALPLVLAGSVAPATCAMWLFLVSYVFVGVEEVGSQVEQPFEITPMTRICTVIMLNIEEAIAIPPVFADLSDA